MNEKGTAALGYAGHSGAQWRVVEKLCVGGRGPCVDDADGKQVACIGPYVEDAETKARLIAAAPDMYEALLRSALPVLEERAEAYGMESEALIAIRAALAKAEGRTDA